METLLLTDDEAVSLAVRRPSPWPGGLPTVAASEEAVAAAAFRGDRSLFVRDLGEHSEVTDLVNGLLGADRRLIVYLADESFRRASWGLASAHYVAEPAWVFETISAVGIHKIGWQGADEHRAYVRALLDGALESGPPLEDADDGEPDWLCALAESVDGGQLVAARRGEVRWSPVPSGGGPLATDQVETSTVDEALTRVFDLLRAED